MSRLLIVSSLLFVHMSIVGCTPLFTQDVHQAACRKLKSDIIFNAATSNDQQAEIQRSQRPLLIRSYEQNCQ